MMYNQSLIMDTSNCSFQVSSFENARVADTWYFSNFDQSDHDEFNYKYPCNTCIASLYRAIQITMSISISLIR